MNCLVTAGPTYENLDSVRRFTNFSTGRLGIELAAFFTARGINVTLLVGEQASYPGERLAKRIALFSSAADLRQKLESLASQSVHAVFHAAAVSDYMFGRIWLRSPRGEMTEIKAGKIPTARGTLLAELAPTPKIITGLRDWFPKARITGWKYEVDGDRDGVIRASEKQLRECLTDACVANGPAYGEGFGLVRSNGKSRHLSDRTALFRALAELAEE